MLFGLYRENSGNILSFISFKKKKNMLKSFVLTGVIFSGEVGQRTNYWEAVVNFTSSVLENDHFCSHMECLNQKKEEKFLINNLYSRCTGHFVFKF